MAQEDNRLGAPTEGLGQTVTFATDVGGGAPQLQARRTGRLQAEQRGGEARINPLSVPIPDATAGRGVLDAIVKLGGAGLQKRIDEQKQEAYVAGMQRVAAGEAVKEVVNEQPWYSQLFGTTPVVEGARAYASFSKVQGELAAIETEMPTLRQSSPDEFRQAIVKRVQAVSTGDSGTDALVQQQFMKELPGLLKAQAKEHIGWQQNNFAKQLQTAQATVASRYAGFASTNSSLHQAQDLLVNDSPASFSDANDLLERKVQLVQSFTPPANIPLEVYQKATTASIAGLLSQKNLHAYNVLDEAGLIDGLGAENAKKLRDLADRAEGRARAEMPAELADELGKIKAMPRIFGGDPANEAAHIEHIKSRVARLNESWKALTGAREPLVQGNTLAELQANLHESAYIERRRLDEAVRRANEKAQTDEQKAAEAAYALNLAVGSLKAGSDVGGVHQQTLDAAWDQLANNPAELSAARIAQFERGEFDKRGKRDIQQAAETAVAAKDWNSFDHLYRTQYAPLIRQGDTPEAVAAGYFDATKHAGKFSAYHNLVKHLDPKNPEHQSRFAAAFVAAITPQVRLKVTKGSEDAVGLKAVNDATGAWLLPDKVAVPGMAPDIQADRAVKSHLRDDLWMLIKDRVHRSGLPVADAVKAVLAEESANGLEYGGGFYWQTKDGKGIRSQVNALGKAAADNAPAGVSKINLIVQPEQFDDALGQSVDKRVKEAGLDPDSVSVHYWSNGGRSELAIVGALEKGGTTHLITLSPQQIYDEAIARRPAVKPVPEGQQPSIYNTDPEAWRKYRDWQAQQKASKPK